MKPRDKRFEEVLTKRTYKEIMFSFAVICRNFLFIICSVMTPFSGNHFPPQILPKIISRTQHLISSIQRLQDSPDIHLLSESDRFGGNLLSFEITDRM